MNTATSDHKPSILVARRVVFFARADEVLFFHALKTNPAVHSMRGEGEKLFIEVDRAALDDDALQALVALFLRYKVDLSQLAQLQTTGNKSWLADPRTPWYDAMFKISVTRFNKKHQGALRHLDRNFRQLWSKGEVLHHPIGSELRHGFPERWFRIHSLVGSKRYADTQEEWDVLEHRHRTIGNSLFADDERCFVVFPDFEVTRDAMAGINFVESSLPGYRPMMDEPTIAKMLCVIGPWNFKQFQPLLRAVANDEVRGVSVMSLAADRIYAPYDGGADCFVVDPERYTKMRDAFTDWRPANAMGL